MFINISCICWENLLLNNRYNFSPLQSHQLYLKLCFEAGLKFIQTISLRKQSWSPPFTAITAAFPVLMLMEEVEILHPLFFVFAHVKFLGTWQTIVIWFFRTAAEMARSGGRWELCLGYIGLFLDIVSVFFRYRWLVAESRAVKMIGFVISDLELPTCWLCNAFHDIRSSKGLWNPSADKGENKEWLKDLQSALHHLTLLLAKLALFGYAAS